MRWKEYLDGNVFWKKKGILEGKKEGVLVGNPMVCLCTEMNIYAKQEEEMDKYPKQRL